MTAAGSSFFPTTTVAKAKSWYALLSSFDEFLCCVWNGDGAGNTVEENSSIVSLIQIR